MSVPVAQLMHQPLSESYLNTHVPYYVVTWQAQIN